MSRRRVVNQFHANCHLSAAIHYTTRGAFLFCWLTDWLLERNYPVCWPSASHSDGHLNVKSKEIRFHLEALSEPNALLNLTTEGMVFLISTHTGDHLPTKSVFYQWRRQITFYPSSMELPPNQPLKKFNPQWFCFAKSGRETSECLRRRDS